MGRPTKLIQQRQDAICKAVEAGATLAAAAATAGVHYTTLRAWVLSGESEESGLHRDFYDAIKRAEANAIMRNLEQIQEAGKQQWQASAWWLERRFPEQFGRKAAVADMELANEKTRLEIAKLQAEIERLRNPDGSEETADDGFMEALKGRAAGVWREDDDDDRGAVQ